jgi:transposase-like protein
MALDFKRRHLQPEVMLMLIRWYVAYVLSYSLPEGQILSARWRLVHAYQYDHITPF